MAMLSLAGPGHVTKGVDYFHNQREQKFILKGICVTPVSGTVPGEQL